MYQHPNLAALLESKDISNADLAGRKVIIRSVLNVVMDSAGNISDATRIVESLPALKMLGEKSARVVIMAHLGRPTMAREPEFSLEPVRIDLENRLGQSVTMLKDEAAIDDLIANSQNYHEKYYLLENIRYFEGEEAKDTVKREEFARKLAKMGDLYVNDAFADYREAASTVDVVKFLPAYLGPAFIKEVKALSNFAKPARPFVAVLGGAKLSEKLDAMLALAESADKVLVGGAMAYTLMVSQEINVGKSKIEEDKVQVAGEIMSKFKDKILLPIDHLVVEEFSSDAATEIISSQVVPEGKIAVDIGPQTIDLFKSEISRAESLLWNGPMGVFEWESAGKGTAEVGESIAQNTKAFKLAGGGDSIAAINKYCLNGFDHISTGGGAMLAYLSYEHFPTLEAIINKN